MCVDHRIVQARILLRLLEPRGIRLQVHKLQGIGGRDIGVENFELIIIQQQRQAGARINPEMLVAFRTDVQIVFQVLLPNNLPAVLAFDPQPLGADLLLAGGIQFSGLALKPSHKQIG